MNPNACAIALAACRQVKGATAARVHLSCLYVLIKGNKVWLRWHVPEYATREIVAFDRGGRFVPSEIDFVPVSTKALVRRVKRIRGEPATKRTRKSTPVRHYTSGVRQHALANDPPSTKKGT